MTSPGDEIFKLINSPSQTYSVEDIQVFSEDFLNLIGENHKEASSDISIKKVEGTNKTYELSSAFSTTKKEDLSSYLEKPAYQQDQNVVNEAEDFSTFFVMNNNGSRESDGAVKSEEFSFDFSENVACFKVPEEVDPTTCESTECESSGKTNTNGSSAVAEFFKNFIVEDDLMDTATESIIEEAQISNSNSSDWVENDSQLTATGLSESERLFFKFENLAIKNNVESTEELLNESLVHYGQNLYFGNEEIDSIKDEQSITKTIDVLIKEEGDALENNKRSESISANNSSDQDDLINLCEDQLMMSAKCIQKIRNVANKLPEANLINHDVLYKEVNPPDELASHDNLNVKKVSLNKTLTCSREFLMYDQLTKACDLIREKNERTESNVISSEVMKFRRNFSDSDQANMSDGFIESNEHVHEFQIEDTEASMDMVNDYLPERGPLLPTVSENILDEDKTSVFSDDSSIDYNLDADRAVGSSISSNYSEHSQVSSFSESSSNENEQPSIAETVDDSSVVINSSEDYVDDYSICSEDEFLESDPPFDTSEISPEKLLDIIGVPLNTAQSTINNNNCGEEDDGRSNDYSTEKSESSFKTGEIFFCLLHGLNSRNSRK